MRPHSAIRVYSAVEDNRSQLFAPRPSPLLLLPPLVGAYSKLRSRDNSQVCRRHTIKTFPPPTAAIMTHICTHHHESNTSQNIRHLYLLNDNAMCRGTQMVRWAGSTDACTTIADTSLSTRMYHVYWIMVTSLLGAFSPNFGEKKTNKNLTTFFTTSALDTAYLRNETSHRQTKTPV